MPVFSFAQDESTNLDFGYIRIKEIKMIVRAETNGNLDISETVLFDTNISQDTFFSWPIFSQKINNIKAYNNQAEIPLSSNQLIKKDGITNIQNLYVSLNNNLWNFSWQQKAEISTEGEFDKLRFIALDQTGINIEKLNIEIFLPESFANQSHSNFYAIHGVENFSNYKNNNIFLFEAKNISTFASVIAEIKAPYNSFEISSFQRFFNKLAEMGVSFWFVIAILLPLTTFLILLIIIYRKRKIENIINHNQINPNLPDDLSASEIGVLFDEKISGNEIATIILELAIKGYIYIIEEENGYKFGKRKNPFDLNENEQIVFNEIFKGRLSGNLDNIEEKAKEELYSESITKLWQNIHNKIALSGWFIQNPAIQVMKIKILGVFMFIFSSFFFFITPIILPNNLIIFLFFGTSLASLIIFNLASSMPMRTLEGKKELEKWLGFRNYLIKMPEKAKYQEIESQIFLKYLPYAVSMNCERMWADNFANAPFSAPDWYVSLDKIQNLPEFTTRLYPMIDNFSNLISTMKDPARS